MVTRSALQSHGVLTGTALAPPRMAVGGDTSSRDVGWPFGLHDSDDPQICPSVLCGDDDPVPKQVVGS